MLCFNFGELKSTSRKLLSNRTYSTSIVISVSILGLDKKVFMNQGDFHAEGDSMLFLKGVPPNLKPNKQSSEPQRVDTE